MNFTCKCSNTVGGFAETPTVLPCDMGKICMSFIGTEFSNNVLFYPITSDGCQGTTDFATIPFHLVWFSAALVELAESTPVHSLILSSHLFFCLPLLLFPFTVPCRIVFAKPKDLETIFISIF